MQVTRDEAKQHLEIINLTKDDDGYGNGQVVVDKVKELTLSLDGANYASRITRRKVWGIKAARDMLREELHAIAEGEPIPAVEKESKARVPKVRKTDLLPAYDNLEEPAEQLGYEEPFLLSRDDIPTPTGRTFKQNRPVVRILCGDGTDRFAHTSDLWQIKDPETGEYRSVKMLAAQRAERAQKRREE